MLTRIKLRRTQKALNSISDVLLEGEALYSFNNKQLVIGDGTTAVNAINNRIYSHSPVGSGLVFAGPSSGQDSYPTFRKLTSEDISGLLTAGSGITVSGTTISNKGVRSVTSSQSDSAAENGTIKVNTNGSTSYVKVKGLGSAAFEDVTDFAGASHVHNYAGSSSPGGAANSAIKLNTARTIRVNLESTNSASFNGTANIFPGVSGVLKIANGGLGNNVGYIRTGLKSGSAAGTYSTAEGYLTISSGVASHAEGNSTTAYGNNSHAEGNGTIANSRSQHVFGEYNVADTQNKSGQANYVEIVGGGTESERKNIRTLKWDGTEEIAGNFLPSENNTKDIGSSTKKWKNIFATTLNGILSKKVTFNNGGSGAASGASFDGGSADVVVSYNTVGAAAASHNHTPAQISSNGTLGAYVSAKASTPLGNAYIRSIYAGTTDMTPGTSSLAYGTIYLVYE